MKRQHSLLIPILLLATAGAATADLTILSKMNEETQTIRTTDHKISMTGPQGGMIFRGDKKLMWILEPEKKSYTEMTEADVQRMAERMNAAMQKMEEMKSQLPPGMVEQMKQAMPAGSPPKRTVTPMNASKEINGFPCKGYTVTTDGGETSEVWSADPKSVRLEPSDLSVFQEFADFMKTMVPGMEQMNDWARDFENPKEDQVPGIPILSIVKDQAGKEIFRTELVKVEHGTVEASAFEPPAGYVKTKMPAMND